MGKKKIKTINDTPLEAQTIGYVKKHRFAWIGALFLIGIFACLIFYMPEIQSYVEKYLKGKASNTTEVDNPPINNETPEETPEEPTPIEIEYIAIAENPTYTIDDKIKFEEISFSNNIFNFKMLSVENNIQLASENYFIELYDENKNLIERRCLTETISPSSRLGLKINVATEPVYYAVRKIDASEYTYIMLDVDENEKSILTCTKNNETIKYTFISELLKNVEDRIIYSNVSDEMKTYYENKINTLNEVVGISASLENNENNTIYLVNVDMNDYNSRQSPYYFNSKTMPREVNFKMIASGFNCE